VAETDTTVYWKIHVMLLQIRDGTIGTQVWTGPQDEIVKTTDIYMCAKHMQEYIW